MKPNALPMILAATLMLGACVGDSNLPVATGKASIRAVNAIITSPDISFRIEERAIGDVTYKGVSPQGRYDDLDYTFNFDVFFAGDTTTTRIASEHIDFIADQDYTLLISGTLTNPVVTLWESTIRTFDASDTIFQARFAHTSYTLGAVDYYFAAPGVAPVMDQQVATLSFGEITDPVDLESGLYVITITTAGDPLDILYTSAESQVLAQSDLIITPFDGDADDIAPVIVRALSTLGAAFSMPDTSFPATVEFLHGSLDLGPSDVYEDETLLSQVIAGHSYRDISAAIPFVAGDYTFRYTPAGGTTAVTLEGNLSATSGTRYRFVALGAAGVYSNATVIPERRQIDTLVKLLLFQASSNFAAVDIYVVGVGETITDTLPFRSAIPTGQQIPAAGLAAGSFDIYVTNVSTQDILAGPVQLDVVLGDVVDLVVFDTADPAVLDIAFLPVP